MAELDDRFVKRGYWIDWSKGPIVGQTYTVEAETGTLIVALLTILASVATAQLWNLVTFTLHQMRAHGVASEGLFWQQQVLLRTMPTPTAFLADSLKISWAWRSKVPHSILRALPVLAFALLFTLGSIAGGISTSYAVDNSNIEVLVDSPFCGRINNTKVFSGTQQAVSVLATHGDSIQSYATSCYQNSSSLPALCRNTFHRPNITFSADPVACPWNDTMCAGEGSSAIAMDSGVIDMRTHFGLNIKEEDTVKLRRRTTCNVLPRAGHVFERPPEYLNRGNPAERWTLEYGSWKGVPENQHPEVTFNLESILVEHQMSFYTTDSVGGVINPLAEMSRTDADVALIVVWPNAVVYENPVEDPLFAAHRIEMRQQASGKDKALYWSDHKAGVVGCAIQHQYCYPRPGKEDYCTPLGPSAAPDTPTTIYPDASPIQASILQLLQSLTRVSDMNRSPHLGNLRASKTVMVGHSPGLPADQWIREVTAWEAFVWTGFQTLLSVSVIGPKVFDDAGDAYIDEPTSVGDKQLCASLRMRKAGGFANVNVFALVFVTTFASLISLFSMFVLRFCIFLSRFRKALAPRIDRWVQDGVFQLQRRAFDAQGEACWIDLEKEIPVTKGRERLYALFVKEKVVKEKENVGSLKTEVGIEESEQKGGTAAEDEVVEWKRFRVSVGRVDTGATLVAPSTEQGGVKGKK
ncbi:hypothetical protein BU23DRAFT_636137 [Bimuria novae-zelandiae CBS 107.79]|uniref:Uncharacterized protein n=1 Tax=Bimuria novae-zelandiae CBS 107.79 TaxID=1447943 RepID=A0A6A5VAT3_9PLEO|nr:hypothetical protein BU23DRAFT_636137 [Bimuria novae-zelandiae CBS 107.79]